MIKGSSVRLRVYRSTIAAAAAAAALVSTNVGLAATSFATPTLPHVDSATGGNQSSTVTWTPRTGGTAYYNIDYLVWPYTGTIIHDYNTPANGTSETTTGLTNGQEYEVIVEETIGDTVYDSQSGVFVTPNLPATAPAAPTGVNGSADDSSVDLSWTAGSDHGSAITGYTIAYTDTTNGAGSGSQTTSGTGTSATVTGLVPGDGYTFTVTATNGVGTGPASDASSSVTPYTTPDAPTGVTATGANASADVSWTAAADGFSPITDYTVDYTDTSDAAGDGSFDTTATATSAVVPNLVNGDSYTFTVVATNADGDGPASGASGSVTAATTPAAPSGVTATTGTDLATANQVTVGWVAPADGGLAITGYAIAYTDTTTPGHNGSVSAGAGATSTVVTGLRAGDVYTFTVAATNGRGTGGASGPQSATPVNIPGTPTGISAVAGPGGAQATLHWTAPAAHGSAITGYTVQAIDTSDPSGDSDQTATAGGGATSGTVGGLVPGDIYTLRVIATNAIGDSVPSHASNIVHPFTTPGTPSSVSASGDDGSADLSWSAPDDGGSAITGYRITYTDAANPGDSGTWTSSGSGLSATVPGLVGGESYTFTVAAVNAAGTGSESDPSGSVDVVSAPDAPSAVTVTAGPAGSEASIGWTAPTDIGGSAITGYTVTLDDGVDPVVTVNAGAGDLSAVADGLVPGATYTVTVVATNAIGTSGSATAATSVTPFTTPDAPTAVTGTRGNDSVDLTWTAPADNGSPITDYTITYTDTTDSAGDGSYTPVGTGSSTTVPNLNNGDSYTFTVTATNAAGDSTASDPSSAVTPATTPDAVTDVIATADSSSADLSWTAPGDNGSPITDYTITYTDTDNALGDGTYDTTSPETSATVPTLVPGDSYTFTVTAVNDVGAGTASGSSSPVSPYTTPDAPSGVTATADASGADLSWTAPGDGGSPITGYTITYTDTSSASGDGVYNPTGTDPSATVPDLNPGDTYTFTVTAINAAGDSIASDPSTSVSPYTTPDAPTAVTGTRGNGSVDLTWTAPADNGSPITGYTITYTDTTDSIGDGSYSPSGTGTSTTVPNLNNGDSYTFTVTATNAAGDSTPSDPSSTVTPATTPDSPTDVVATGDSSSADLSWTAPADNGSPITDYTITYTDTTNSVGDGSYDTTSPETSATVPTLVPGDSYTFTVTAVNGVGAGTASGSSSPVSPYTTPDAPSGVTATADASGADLTWTAPGDGGSPITGYTITYTDTSNASGDGVYNPTGTDPSATVPDLNPGDTYTFTVTAINAAGDSIASDPSTSVSPYTTPDAPTAVTGTRGNGSVDLTWTAPADNGSPITGYTITYTDTTDSIGDGSYSPSGTGTSTTVPNLNNGDSYTFTVTATNAAGDSTPSDPSSTVTPATTPDSPTDVVATGDSSSADLSWTAPADNGSPITDYTITYTDTDNALGDGTFPSAGTGTSATVPNLVPGDHYRFTVAAVNNVGSGAASAQSAAVRVFTSPGAPRGVSAAVGQHGAPVVNWTAPAFDGGSPLTGYTITYTDTTHSLGTGTLDVGPDATSASIEDIIGGDSYTFTVTARNAGGAGTPSSPVAGPVTAYAAPGAPTAVLATAGSGRASVRWVAPDSTGGSPITTYTVRYTDLTNPAHSVSHVVDPGERTDGVALVPGDTYTVTVTANNLYATGAASVPSDAVVPYTVAGAPTAVVATAGDGTAVVSWSAPASDGDSAITGYVVTVTDRTSRTNRTVRVGPTPGATVTGLTDGDQYTFSVVAINAAGSSAASASSAAVTPLLRLSVREATLLPAVGVGLSPTLAGFSLTLDRPGAVTVSLVKGTAVVSSTSVTAGGTAISGNVRIGVTTVASLGDYTWVVRDADGGRVLLTRGVVLKQNSFLALIAKRSGSTISVLGVAKWASLDAGKVLPLTGKAVDVQRFTAHGWVTVRTITTDRNGHLTLTLTVPQRVGLRLVEAGTAQVVGVISNTDTL